MKFPTHLSKVAIIITVAVIAAAVIFNNERPMNVFRMATDSRRSLGALDPSRIDILSEAVLLRNLFSSLFEYDLDGKIVTGLAETFRWENGNLRVSLRTGPLLSNGKALGTDDVYFTLMRLMLLNENRHGDLKSILCPGITLRSLRDECAGLKIEENELVFRPASPALAHHLIPLLATVDYRIIPAAAFEFESGSIPIRRFDLTSGPYYAESFDDSGNAVLTANKYHYAYSEEMPQRVEILAISKSDALRRFINGDIDALPTNFPLTNEDVIRIQSEVAAVSIAKSLNLKIRVIFFGKSALRDFSAANRFALAKFVESKIQKFQSPFEEPTMEFFQDLASGYLTDDQKVRLRSYRESGSKNGMSRKAVIGTTETGVKFWEPIVNETKDLTTKVFKAHPVELPSDEKPDIYIGTNDVAFNRSSSVIAYNLKTGFFGLEEREANEWFNKYLNIEDPAISASELNKLHFSALMNCAFYPVGAAPYVLMTRNSWKAVLNPYFSSTELWLIRRN